VEIEAAAMGLPLLLTPHHGSEMILKDGVNGLVLPFDAAGIAAIIVNGIRMGFPDANAGLKQFQSIDVFATDLQAQITACVGKD